MTNKKQSSVEWFADELDKVLPYVNEKVALEFRRILIQAKSMHKEEIETAWDRGCLSENGFFETFEQFYKETYGE